MDFLNAKPLFLTLTGALIAVAAGVLWRGNRRRQRLTEELTGPVMAARLTLSLDRSRRRWRQILLLLALVFLAVAGARPWWGYRLEETPARSRDLLLAVDCSRSMLAEDVSPSRLEHAKWWIKEVVTASPGDRFGLIAFAGSAFLECPLTQDRNTLFQFLDDLDTDTIPIGGTNMQEALSTAREAFEGAEGPYRAVLLVSDGGEQQGRAAAEQERLKEAEIPLFVVGVGDPTQVAPIRDEEGKYIRDQQGDVVETTLHETMLRDLATATSGVYVRTTSIKPNTEAVLSRVRALIPEQHEGSQTRRPRERYQLPLAVALVLLLIRMTLGERRQRAAAAATCLLLVAATRVSAAAAPPPANDAGMTELKQQLEAAEGTERGRLAFNLGLLHHRADQVEEAESRYLQAMDEAGDRAGLAAFSAQNLAALKQQQADAVLQEEPDKALELLDRAEAYNREALRLDPNNEGAARNQERLLQQRRQAQKLKELREKLKKQQQQARDQTQQAEQKQQQANRASKPGEKQERQKQAQKKTRDAGETAEQLQKTAQKAGNEAVENQARQARQALQKARQAQEQGQGQRAEEHIKEARRALGAKNGEEQPENPESQNGDQRDPADKQPPPQSGGNQSDNQDGGPQDSRQTQKGAAEPGDSDLDEDIDQDVARALLLQMLEEEEELRDAVKEYRARNRKLKPVEKDW